MIITLKMFHPGGLRFGKLLGCFYGANVLYAWYYKEVIPTELEAGQICVDTCSFKLS